MVMLKDDAIHAQQYQEILETHLNCTYNDNKFDMVVPSGTLIWLSI